jgi:shikimate kinase
MVSRIFLIGYRGSGKTTVARQLALRLAFDWVDADVEIELRAGKSIASIFADDGEGAFRDLEQQVVAELCRRERTVVALGGGAILREENRQAISSSGTVVWLKAGVDTLSARILGDPTTAGRRPNLTNAGGRSEIEAILAARSPIYSACADLEVDTEDKDVAEVVDAILVHLRGLWAVS